MKIKLLLSFFFLITCLTSYSQAKPSVANDLINLKDSQVVDMARAYLRSNIERVIELFPGYKNHLPALDSIKAFANTKNFAMRPNFLRNKQADKTIIALIMSNEKFEVIGFVVTFTTNTMESKIESIVREPKYDQAPERVEEIREL